MAGDAPKPTSPKDDALWFFAILAVLVVLWYFAGGPGKADLRGLFLSPPSPLGSGDAYGPQLNNADATSTDATVDANASLEAPAPLNP